MLSGRLLGPFHASGGNLQTHRGANRPLEFVAASSCQHAASACRSSRCTAGPGSGVGASAAIHLATDDQATFPHTSEQNDSASGTSLSDTTYTSNGDVRRISHEQIHLKRRAKAARLAGRTEDALQLLIQGTERFPNDTHFLVAAASLLSKLGRHRDAAHLLRRTLQLAPGNQHALTAAAIAAATRRNQRAARALFARAVAASADSGAPPAAAAVPLQAWAVMEAEAGAVDAARRLFARARDAMPSHGPIYTAWGKLEASEGDSDRARAIFKQGASRGARHAPLLHAWASLEQQEGNWEAARQLLLCALNADPSHLPTHISLGRVEFSLGGPPKARAAFERAAEVVGQHPRLLAAWAALEQVRHCTPAARRVWERLWQLPGDCGKLHVPGLVSAAKLESRAGNAGRALQLYKEALGLEPSNVVALHSFAEHLLRYGQAEAAEQLLQRLEAVDPGNGHLCHTRGLMAQQRGELEAARQWFERGVNSAGEGGGAKEEEAVFGLGGVGGAAAGGEGRGARPRVYVAAHERHPNLWRHTTAGRRKLRAPTPSLPHNPPI